MDELSLKQKRAQKFLTENLNILVVTHQNIFETLRVITYPKYPRPMHIKDALVAVENILEVCDIVSPNWKTKDIAIDLIKKYHLSSDMIFDAYLVATALSNGINEIATDNVKDFKRFTEIKVINPFS